MRSPDRWPAPAKLNLLLRVVGRRSDGYHLLQTVFQFVDLCDWLSFRVRADGEIHRSRQIQGVREEDDLVIRAARALQGAAGTGLGVDIRLEKRIPMGAGLGGGSSDAATTLVALNSLWECGLTSGQLQRIGLTLGADVPVFVHGRAAWAEGVGEQLTDLELPAPVYLVLAPDVHVETAKVFQDPELTRNSRRITIRDFLAGEQSNDCLPVVKKHYPTVAAAYDWLAARASARLTGTGACVFAPIPDGKDAAATLGQAAPRGLTAIVVHGVNRSPLLDATGGA